MKRREVLKGLSMAAGGALVPGAAWSMLGRAQTAAPPPPPLAVPIRGLLRKDGRLMQPIQISVQHSGPGAEAVTKVNGVDVDRRTLAAGQNSFRVLTEPVMKPQDASVTVTMAGAATSSTVKLLPVRKALVYVLPHSHHDLGYTDLQANIEEKQMHNLTLAMELANKTADYPEGARFVWNLEVLWSADMFLQRKSQAEKDAFFAAVKAGQLSLNGMYANELTGLCRPEELVQLFRYRKVLGEQCGVPVDSAMLSDVPGFTWGTVTAMAQAGIRYFSAGPNGFDRIGTLRITWHEKPFWALSPSGKEKVLVWMPGHGYSIWAAPEEMVAGTQELMDTVDYPYDISYVRWSGHGDNGVPDPQLPEFVKNWGQEYEWPKFVISSTSTAFAAFEKRYGDQIPQFRGDLTPYWEDGAGSSALETAINRNASDRLTQAAALTAMLPKGTYRAAEYADAWRNILLYSEHTWGAAGSVRDPESAMTVKQWERKRQFATDGEKQSKALLESALHAYGSGLGTAAIDVVNTTSWPRIELVLVAKEMSAAGEHVKDNQGKPVASQRLATGELAFLAADVPGMGCARFHLSAEKPHEPSQRVTVRDGVLENGIVRARIDVQTGSLVELALLGRSANLIDTTSGEAANEYLYVEGKDFSEQYKEQSEAAALHYRVTPMDGPDVGSIQRSGPVRITVEDSGPLVACLRIESSAPGCNSLVRRIRLTAGADWLEISNLVDKKRAPSNPGPITNDEGGAWSNYGGKESVHFAFPLAIPDGKMHMDIPLAEMQPEIDQLPGCCKNWLPVGRWIDVANEQHGITWVTLDAPLVEIGEISATLVGSQNNPLLWRQHIAPTQKFYSWAMNNHWETNYRAYQEGVVEFRYALRAHRGYDPAAANRFAIGLSQPLLAAPASAGEPRQSLLRIEPSDVLAIAAKPSEDDAAWIVRLFGASGSDRIARLRWPTSQQPKVWLSDTSEKPVAPAADEIPVAGWDLVTLRIDRANS